ncbi:MAG: hypothetical protein ACLFPU_07310, partial [Dehalococcoidia bacterium]
CPIFQPLPKIHTIYFTLPKFADHRRLEMVSGQQTTIYLITDGPDDLLTRQRQRGDLQLMIEGDDVGRFNIGDIQDGRIPVHVSIPDSANSGQGGRIVASLEMQPATFLTDSREIRVVPPPPPYVGMEPPTTFEFAKNTTMSVELGGRSVARINTDARNDLLTRAIAPARIQSSVDIPNVFTSVRGPRDGIVNLEVHANLDASVEKEGLITAELTLFDGTIFTASRPIKLIKPTSHPPGPGTQSSPVPAYKLKRVWQHPPEDEGDDIAWENLDNYNDRKVGHWELNGNELWLYVNMDERQFRSERLRWGKRFGESTSQRLMDRYVAYLAFHMYQLHDKSYSSESLNLQDTETPDYHSDEIGTQTTIDPESYHVTQELQRVAATLIQTLRSEAELVRIQGGLSNGVLSESG